MNSKITKIVADYIDYIELINKEKVINGHIKSII